MVAERDGAPAVHTQQSFMEALRRLDPEDRGSVRREDLVTVMRTLFPTWSDAETEAVASACGSDSATGRVDLERFSAWLFQGASGVEVTSGPITPEDFSLALANMTRAWESVPEEDRLPEDDEVGFFEDDCLARCQEMITRWHSGKSSHPHRYRLAAYYPASEAGARALEQDLLAMRLDPIVEKADRELRMTKFTAPPRGGVPARRQSQPVGGAADHIDRAFNSLLLDFEDSEPSARLAVEA